MFKLPPWGLVRALAFFLQVDVLLFCKDKDEDVDWLSVQAEVNLPGGERVWTWKVVLPGDLLQQPWLQELDMAYLVVCNLNGTHSGRSKPILPKNVFLLTSEEALFARSFPFDLNLESSVLTYPQVSSQTEVKIYEHYGLKGRALSAAFGTWSISQGLQILEKEMIGRRSDLGGVVLKTTILHWNPIAIKIDNTSWTGIMIDIFSTLGRSLNFTLEHTSPEDGEWGSKIADNSSESKHRWTGMMGELASGRADLCLGGLGASSERQEAIDFSVPVVEGAQTLLAPNPALSQYHGPGLSSLFFVSVFRVKAWMGLLVMAVCYSLCLGLPEALSRAESDSLISRFAILLKVFFSFGAYMLQRDHMDEHTPFFRNSGRICFATAQLLGLLMLVVYSGDLTATMTVTKVSGLPKTFEEIIEKEFTLIVTRGTLAQSIMESSTGSVVKHVYDNNVKIVDWSDGEDAIKSTILSTEATAYFGASLNFLDDERIIVSKTFLDSVTSAVTVGYQKNSELRPMFNFHLGKLRQSGLWRKSMTKWLEGGRPVPDLTERIFVEEVQPFPVTDLLFPFSMLGLGMVIGMAVMYTERWSAWKHEIKLEVDLR